MDKENERNSIRFLNHIHHYKRRYPAGKWLDYWLSSHNNSDKTNLHYFVEQNFSLATLKFIVPKFVRLFDYDDVDGQILYLLLNDINVLEIQDLLEQRIEQSRKDKLLHTIT